jgi:hypothetical protein
MCLEIAEEDAYNLHVLDCLLNGKDIKQNVLLRYQMVKGVGAQLDAQLLLLKGEEFNFTSEVKNYAGYLEVFGCKIPTSLWGISTRCVLDPTELERQGFREAKEGSALSCRAVTRGPIKLAWMNEGE